MPRPRAVVGPGAATENAVNRRQANKNAAAYSQAAPQAAPPPAEVQYVEVAAPAPEEDVITQLERLGALHAQGILTDEEFASQKAKLLG